MGKDDALLAGMESIEDHPEEELYRFMKEQSKKKQERERMKALTYDERM